MICLTKYVTRAPRYQRENRTFMMVSGWLASPQFAAHPSVVTRADLSLPPPSHLLLYVHTTEPGFPGDASIAKLKFQHQQ